MALCNACVEMGFHFNEIFYQHVIYDHYFGRAQESPGFSDGVVDELDRVSDEFDRVSDWSDRVSDEPDIPRDECDIVSMRRDKVSDEPDSSC